VPEAQRRDEEQGRLLFGYFILAKQNKVTSCRATPGLCMKGKNPQKPSVNGTTYAFLMPAERQ
jgi:hypothetical protein